MAGLVLRPHATEISFNRSEPAGYGRYTQQLHELLQREYRPPPPPRRRARVHLSLLCAGYNDSVQESNELCLVGEYTQQDRQPVKKACQFKRSVLQQCSGLRDSSFGYADGKPCVIIKMNRVRMSPR